MIMSTSNSYFYKYGETYEDYTGNKKSYPNNYMMEIKDKHISYFMKTTEDVYIKPMFGTLVLVITDSLKDKYDSFVFQKIIKIKKGMYFNFISLTDLSKIELNFDKKCIIENIFLDSVFQLPKIKPAFTINELITDYINAFKNQKITFYEDIHYYRILYLFSGTIQIFGKIQIRLHAQQLILLPPCFSQKEEISGHCTFLTILLDLDTLDKDMILKPVYVEQKEIQNFIQNSLEEKDQMKIQIVNQLLNKLHEFR